MSGPLLTEERLRSWLDSNQVQRERMCLALLSLVPGYANVRPRRPKGGPDGGRDIEASFRDLYQVWGAVGFRNGADDSRRDKRWVKGKYAEDLDRALDENPGLEGFVFFTNVDLTPSEIDDLTRTARGRGQRHVEIFYRERLRILLDSPEGLLPRFQYLDIELTKAEQAAFFAKFGGQLERLLTEGFDTVDRKLARIEFFHDCRKELRNLSFLLRLKSPLSPEDLGHFRFMLEIIDLNAREPHPTLWLAGRDAYPTYHHGGESRLLPATKMLAWSRHPDDDIQGTVLGLGMGVIVEISSFTGIYGKGPFTRLEDLDHKHLNMFVTSPLVEHISAIGIIANDYVIATVPHDMLVPKEGEPLAEWPEELTEDEAAVPWNSILLKGDDPSLPPPAWPVRTWFIDFDTYTPEKLQRGSLLSNTAADH